MHVLAILQNLLILLLLAVLLERALAVLFESYFYVRWISRFRLKEIIFLSTALLISVHYQIDMISVIVFADKRDPSIVGIIASAAIVAGLGKGSNKFFRDILGIQSNAARAAMLESREVRTTHVSTPKVSEQLSATGGPAKERESPSYVMKIFEALLQIIVAVVAGGILWWLGFNK
jgi:hypothetical protein